MIASFSTLPLYGKRLESGIVPESAVHSIEFKDLSKIAHDDLVWIIDKGTFICCCVRSITRRTPHETPELVSFEIEYGHPHGYAKRTIEMATKTGLYYIDLFFLYRHHSDSIQKPSAEIIPLKDRRGGG